MDQRLNVDFRSSPELDLAFDRDQDDVVVVVVQPFRVDIDSVDCIDQAVLVLVARDMLDLFVAYCLVVQNLVVVVDIAALVASMAWVAFSDQKIVVVAR